LLTVPETTEVSEEELAMSEGKNVRDPEQLLRLLTEQRDLYVRLRELSEQQRTLISSDRPEQLLNILRERQSLVGALARLNEQLAPFRRDWEGLYARLPNDCRERANTLLGEVNALLRVILQADKEDSAMLSARKQDVAERIRGVSDAQSANSAYARQAGPAAARPAADLTG
jgi:flagellar biosynthesis/type III secretory pathway chaperone